MADFSASGMRARFHEIAAKIAAVRTQAAPIREAYDAKRNELAQRERDELKPLIAQLKSIEGPLYELEMEAARLARALGGKTGPAAAS